MTKIDFLLELSDRLEGLNEEDRDQSCQFYGEMIDDRIEEGMSEEEAVADLGSIDDIVKQIIAEIAISRIIKTKIKATRRLGVIAIIALVFGGLILLPIGISLVAAFFALYVSVWSVVVSFYAVAFSFSASGLLGIAMLAISAIRGEMYAGIFILGAGLLLAGISIPLYRLCADFTKLMCRFSKYVFVKIKTYIKRKLLKGGRAQ
jgi:uncharacterized membrane protein